MAAAAAGAPPPPPGGNGGDPSKRGKGKNDPPWVPDDNKHNRWITNTKIKTCKCSICGERVKKYSFQCSECLFHICSECAEGDGISSLKYKMNAYYQLRDKCKCGYKGTNRTPGFSRWLKENPDVDNQPPQRFEEDQRMKQIKAKTKQKKELAEQAAAQPKTYAPSGPPPEFDDDTYEGSHVLQPTTAANKTDRGLKRKNYRDPETPSEPDEDETPPLKKTHYHAHPPSRGGYTKVAHRLKTQRTPFELEDDDVEDNPAALKGSKSHAKVAAPVYHLRGGTTVIVGAGIVGLCIARELAARVHETSTWHKIVIVDIQEDYCQLASGECSGLLSIHHAPEAINEVASLSMQCWTEMFDSDPDEALHAVGFRQSNAYKVQATGAHGQKYRPSWYAGPATDSFRPDPQTAGKLDTSRLATWLYNQCKQQGVDFRFRSKVSSTLKHPDRDIIGVRIVDIHEGGEGDMIECQNIVLAAGPFTTEIIRLCNRKAAVSLENNVQAALWVDVPKASISAGDDVALILSKLAKTDESLEDKVTVAAHLARNDIRVAAIVNGTEQGPMRETDAFNSTLLDHTPLDQLERLATKTLDVEGPKKRGFSSISTSSNGLPVIDKVPASKLGVEYKHKKAADARLDGVWLCFGFGMYGTTLAPGAARALVRRMLGEPSGIKDGHFAIPR